MSLRALTREPSDYVVRFLTDGSVMVRQKVHIVADSRIRLNEIYPVRWGENDKDTCDAIILAAGDYIAMSAKADAARKDERFVLASTSDETVVTSNPPEDAQSYCSEPSQASPSPPPPQRRRVGPAHSTPRVTPVRPRATRSKTIRTLTKSGKPAVRVIKVVTPHDFHEPLPTIRRPKQRKMVRPTPQQPPSTTLITSRPAQSSTPVSPFTPSRPSFPANQLGPITSTMAAIGSAVVSIQRACDTMDRKFDTVL